MFVLKNAKLFRGADEEELAKVFPQATTHPAFAARQAGLTPRDVAVLTRIAGGDSYQAIAAASGLSVPQVTAMIGSLYTKLGVDSNAGLAAFAFKSGLV